MPLQNRCDPTGRAHRVGARGMFTGNRGIIHDAARKKLLRRQWTTKSWIICVCEWNGRRREPMGRNGPNGRSGWTELFFLDEVTALAGGHRPCFACRRRAALHFAEAFAAGNGIDAITAARMDSRLHCERRLSAAGNRDAMEIYSIGDLPDGSVFEVDGNFFASKSGMALRWSFEGYRTAVSPWELETGTARLVTPASTVAALRAGYRPVWHGSARANEDRDRA